MNISLLVSFGKYWEKRLNRHVSKSFHGKTGLPANVSLLYFILEVLPDFSTKFSCS